VRGTISVYDMDARHRLVKTIQTVRDVDDVKGVAASAATGRIYMAYRTRSGIGMLYCLDLRNDVALWNRAVDPDVDRLSVDPGGSFCTSRAGKAARPMFSTLSMP